MLGFSIKSLLVASLTTGCVDTQDQRCDVSALFQMSADHVRGEGITSVDNSRLELVWGILCIDMHEHIQIYT